MYQFGLKMLVLFGHNTDTPIFTHGRYRYCCNIVKVHGFRGKFKTCKRLRNISYQWFLQVGSRGPGNCNFSSTCANQWLDNTTKSTKVTKKPENQSLLSPLRALRGE